MDEGGNRNKAEQELFRYVEKKNMYQIRLSSLLLPASLTTLQTGLLIWQLNEIWPTGGWGLLEYGTRSQDGSQIVGGRWKVSVHHPILSRNLLK
jgi:hypothetical protein